MAEGDGQAEYFALLYKFLPQGVLGYTSLTLAEVRCRQQAQFYRSINRTGRDTEKRRGLPDCEDVGSTLPRQVRYLRIYHYSIETLAEPALRMAKRKKKPERSFFCCNLVSNFDPHLNAGESRTQLTRRIIALLNREVKRRRASLRCPRSATRRCALGDRAPGVGAEIRCGIRDTCFVAISRIKRVSALAVGRPRGLGHRATSTRPLAPKGDRAAVVKPQTDGTILNDAYVDNHMETGKPTASIPRLTSLMRAMVVP